MERKQKQLYWLLFLYGTVMVYLLFARKETTADLPYWELVRRQSSLVPFVTIRRQLRHLIRWRSPWLIRHSLLNLGGNVLLFLPMGYFLPALWSRFRSYPKVLLLGSLTIIAVEVLQVLTLVGRCDVDDLILNLLGVSIGYLLFRKLDKK